MMPAYAIDVIEQSHNHVILHVTLSYRVHVAIPLSRWDANKIAHAIRTDTPIPYRIISRTGLDYHWQGKVARQCVTITLHYVETTATITLGHYETRRVADLLASAPDQAGADKQ